MNGKPVAGLLLFLAGVLLTADAPLVAQGTKPAIRTPGKRPAAAAPAPTPGPANKLEAMEAEAPEFAGKYKNLNLITKGVQMTQELPAQIQGLKESFKAFKQIKKDPQAAAAAATEIQTKVQGLASMVRGFFQKR